MEKVVISGRVDPSVYKKFERYMKKNKIPNRSNAVEKIVTEYLNSTENLERNASSRNKEQCGDSSIRLKESLEAIKKAISEMEKQLEEVSEK